MHFFVRFFITVFLVTAAARCHAGDKASINAHDKIVEQLNEAIPMFGDENAEQKLRALIADTVKSKPNAATLENPLNINDLPSFNRKVDFRNINGSGLENVVQGLLITNYEMIDSLDRYDRIELVGELEKRFLKEEDKDVQLLMQTVAAAYGSRDAALELLEMMKSTDYHKLLKVQASIGWILYRLKNEQPDWIVQMAIASLSDLRYVTNIDYNSSSRLTISYHADESSHLTYGLGNIQCKKAVPFLIQMCERTKGSRGPVIALGSIGDQRAIPVLLKYLDRTINKLNDGKLKFTAFGLSDEHSGPIESLAGLKSREAVPRLLKIVAIPEAIKALQAIGDPAAIPALQKLVQDGGEVVVDGQSTLPKLKDKRVIASKIALASLDKEDGVGRLCKLLDDTSFGKYDRREVVWELGNRADPEAIPSLVRLIKGDPSGTIVNQSIAVLSAFKYKAAVDGLIASFDADFEGKQDWKRAYNSQMFNDNIANSLQEITGEKFGADKVQWLNWWNDARSKREDLK